MGEIANWRCYRSGDLNPQLNSFSPLDLLGTALATAGTNPMSSVGEAIGRSIRPDITRGAKSSSIRAVVLGGYISEGFEALSYNMNIEAADIGALANRVQMVYIRVPEIHGMLPDPFCGDNSFTTEQQIALVEMHAVAAIPNWIVLQSHVIPGSIVEVEFTEGWSRAIVKRTLQAATSFQFLEAAQARDAFNHGTGAFLNSAPGDPGNCNWSNSAKALETVWSSTEYPQWNDTILRNGRLEETGMLVSDPVSGAKLLPPAMEDFKRLAAAFKQKFDGKILKGSGYRPYASQVSVRMDRVTIGNPCGSGEYSAAGKFVGKAATPGTSNHGWGAAVDLRRDDWEHGNVKGKKAGTSKHFQWINKFSTSYNFVFGVTNEHWHLDWMPFTGQVTGWSGMRQTVQTSWTNEGISDSSISLV